MPFEAALVLAGFILVATLIGMVMIITSRRQAAKEDELKQAASARGWTFQSTSEGGYRVHRWTGTTDGISWVAESLRQDAGGKKRSNRRRHISRWHGTFSPGVSGAMVCMGVPKDKADTGAGAAQGEGFFVKLAQKAAGLVFDTSLDLYFGDGRGKEVDAGAMKRVEQPRVPGFIVMAADKDEGARILGQGLERTLLDATHDQSSIFSDQNRPWILIRPAGISMARTELHRNATDVERFIRAGVGLTHAFKFGRATS